MPRHVRLAVLTSMILGGTCAPGGTLAAARGAEPAAARRAHLVALRNRLRPLGEPLAKPAPGDWLAVHKEGRQTFEQYLKSNSVAVDEQRRVLYVQPLGEFDADRRRVLALSVEFLGAYFQLPVKVLADCPLDVVPAKARRSLRSGGPKQNTATDSDQPAAGDEQLLSTWILDDLLPARLPRDGTAIIAFTNSDLWPGPGWNFVFGQASLEKRVGVWSLQRYGDPADDEAAFGRVLLRTIKVATHETGHMFSLPHCTAYRCNMNGSNSLEESDAQPLELCPECLAKVCWATGAEPRKRCEQLLAFCQTQRITVAEAAYEKSLALLPAPAKKK
jgi:archaemetzincin